MIDDQQRLTVAAAKFAEPKTRLIVVCDPNGRMAGVISRTDIVRRISHCTGCTCTETVQTAMVANVMACRPSDSLDTVWNRMNSSGCSHLPILDSAGWPVGILSAQDVLVTRLGEQTRKEGDLLDYVRGVGYH